MPKELPPIRRTGHTDNIIPIAQDIHLKNYVDRKKENVDQREDTHPFLGLYDALKQAGESSSDNLFIQQALVRFKQADEAIITGITRLIQENLRMNPDLDLAFSNALRNFSNRVNIAQDDQPYPLLSSNTTHNHLAFVPEIYVSFLPPIIDSGSIKKAHDAFVGRFLTQTDSILSPQGIHILQPRSFRGREKREPVRLHTYMKDVSLLYSRDDGGHLQAVLQQEAVSHLLASNPQNR